MGAMTKATRFVLAAREPSSTPSKSNSNDMNYGVNYTWYSVWYSSLCRGWYYTDWAGNMYIDNNDYNPEFGHPLRLSKLRLHTEVFPEHLAKFQHVEGLAIDESKLPDKKKNVKEVKVAFVDTIEYY